MYHPMRATAVDESNIGKLQYPLIASPKLDGIRCMITPDGPRTRSGKPIPNAHVYSELDDPLYHGMDGEICVGPYNTPGLMQRSTSGIMSHGGKPDYTFFVFDHFGPGITNFPYTVRRDRLERQVHNVLYEDASVTLLQQWYVHNLEELLKYEEQCLVDGFEGVMLRKPDGIYKHGKSTFKESYLLKMKRFEDVNVEIIGWEPLYENQNAPFQDNLGYQKRSSHSANLTQKQMIGSLRYIVREPNHKFDGVEGSVGSGFDDAQRLKMWDERDSLVGKWGVIKFQSYGSKDAPRMPIWKDFRHEDDI